MQRPQSPLWLLLSPVLLALASCTGGEAVEAPGESSSAPTPETSGEFEAAAIHGVHDVRCGCAIESIGKCGNYIEIAGETLELKGDLGLGPMEFCGKEGLKADVEGRVVDDTFVATTYKLEGE